MGSSAPAWSTLKIGGGGFVKSAWIDPGGSGTYYAALDSQGAIYYNRSVPYCGNTYSGQPATGCWQQLVSVSSITDHINDARNQAVGAGTTSYNESTQGAYAITGCQNNPADVYMVYAGYLRFSSNNGATFTTPSGYTPLQNLNPNGTYRGNNYFLACDPANPAIVLFGTAFNGLQICSSFGTSCSFPSSVPPGIVPAAQIKATSTTSKNVVGLTGSQSFTLSTCSGLNSGSSAPIQAYSTASPAAQIQGTVTSCTGGALVMNVTATYGTGTHADWNFYNADWIQGNPGGLPVAFDPTSSTASSFTHGIAACPYGSGVFESTDGGSTWAQASGGPTTCRNMIYDKFGQIWVSDDTSSGSLSNIWKYSCASAPCGSTGTWTNLNLGGGNANSVQAIAADGGSASAATEVLWFGCCAGAAASGMFTLNGGSTVSAPNSLTITQSAQDVPWLAQNEAFMGTGSISFDTYVSNPCGAAHCMIMGEGVGLWYAKVPSSISATAITWSSITAGYEQLIAQSILALPNGNVVASVQDRDTFGLTSLTSYPPNPSYWPNLACCSIGTQADYASLSPTTVVAAAINNNGVFSTNGAATFSAWNSLPSEGSGGAIAASDANHWLFVALQSQGGDPFCTSDGSTTWNKQTILTVPNGDGWGGGFARWTAAADRVNSGTFFLYNNGTTAPGIYLTQNNCSTWAKVLTGHLFGGADVANMRVRTVPGEAGDLLIVNGEGNGIDYCTTNFSTPATTCTEVTTGNGYPHTTDFATDVCAGPIAPGKSYPSVSFMGEVDGVFGLWYSDDKFQTWTQYAVPPTYDAYQSLSCDPNNLHQIFLGQGGSGFSKYNRLN